ncbi:polysaccharide deacetylase [Leptospira adleri]|nr:polysaccharide deacetylase [Leptospira adleri]
MTGSFFFHKFSQEMVSKNRIENFPDRSMNFHSPVKKGVFHLTRSHSVPS